MTRGMTQDATVVPCYVPSATAGPPDGGASTSFPAAPCGFGCTRGSDPVTGHRHNLTETIPAGPKAGVQAEQVLTRLLNALDERRNPRTNATVNQLLDRYFTMVDAERTTTCTYVGYSRKHIRPLLGEPDFASE